MSERDIIGELAEVYRDDTSLDTGERLTKVLAALHLSPEQAAGLVEGTCVVVPRDGLMEVLETARSDSLHLAGEICTSQQQEADCRLERDKIDRLLEIAAKPADPAVTA